ncbi:hypothetical protein B0H13DRAFT_1898150 [Mycena leptocephala]|nr:hypothetical protein B0H13DRAFT_1898150 [Mycena leptocephala]
MPGIQGRASSQYDINVVGPSQSNIEARCGNCQVANAGIDIARRGERCPSPSNFYQRSTAHARSEKHRNLETAQEQRLREAKISRTQQGFNCPWIGTIVMEVQNKEISVAVLNALQADCHPAFPLFLDFELVIALAAYQPRHPRSFWLDPTNNKFQFQSHTIESGLSLTTPNRSKAPNKAVIEPATVASHIANMVPVLEADRARVADLEAQISHLEHFLSALREEKI